MKRSRSSERTMARDSSMVAFCFIVASRSYRSVTTHPGAPKTRLLGMFQATEIIDRAGMLVRR